MGRSNPSQGFGLVVFGGFPDEARLPSGVGGALYDQAGPGPGMTVPDEPASSWRPTMVGAQSESLEVATATRGGYAGIDGARVVVRIAGETQERDWRGWNEPNLPTSWSAPQSGWGIADYDGPVACALPSGRIAVIAAVDNSVTEGQSWTYDPRTGVWVDGLDWSTTSGIDGPLALAYDPVGGRLIAWTGQGIAGASTTQAFSSTDEGQTWTLYARGMWPVEVEESTFQRIRVAVDPEGREWLATFDNHQMASNDHGISWRLVASLDPAEADHNSYAPIRTASGWLLAYVDAVTHAVMVRLLPSAGAAASGSVPIVVSVIDADAVIGCTDDDGVVYLLSVLFDTESHRMKLHRSLDGGRTWEGYAIETAFSSTNNLMIVPESLVASCGQLHLIYRPAFGAAATVDGNIAVLTFGGWSQVEQGAGSIDVFGTANAQQSRSRFTYGLVTGTVQQWGGVWIPFDTPDGMGWNETVSNGIVTLGSGQPGMSVACTAGQGRIWEVLPPVATLDLVAGEAILIPTVLSATLATIGTTNTGLFLRPVLGNAAGTAEHAPFIDIGRDGIQVRDGTTIRASVGVVLGTMTTHIRWVLRRGGISVWYRIEEIDPAEVWHRVANDVATTSSGGSDSAGLRWGCGGGSAAAATWRMVGTQAGADWLNGIDSPAQQALTSTNGLRGLRWGRALPGAGSLGYPVPFATGADEAIGRMYATGGPTHAGETVSIPVAYEYGAQHLDPLFSASPRAAWKAASPTTQVLVYALDEAEWQGGAVALSFDNLVASALSFELDDGLGGFEPPVVVDLDLVADFRYVLVGRSVSPAAGTDIPDRYFGEGDFVRLGAWLKCETTTGHAWRRIVQSSGGYVTDDTSVQQVRLTLAASGEEGGVDGDEVVSGAGAIRLGAGIHVHYPALDFPHASVRITVEPPDTGDNAVAQAGRTALGRVLAIGGKPDFGSTQTLEMVRVADRKADGTLSNRRKGPPQWVWAFPFTGGILLEKLRFLSNGPDHLGKGGGAPIGTIGDVFHTWTGAVEHLLDSGEKPCVVLPRLPDADATVSDRTLWLFGVLAMDSMDVTIVTGKEGSNEALRLSSATLRETR